MRTDLPRPVAAPVVARGEGRSRTFPLALGALALVFSPTLYDLFRFALSSDLFSYILLIPCIALYLAWDARCRPAAMGRPSRGIALALITVGLVALLGSTLGRLGGYLTVAQDRLALETSGLLIALYGTLCWFYSRATLRPFAFPLGFLVFMIPLPVALIHGIETFMQHGSAAAARLLFEAAGKVFE
ncbi:MAG: exosortase/archaeosortase family protein, partial [Verrucomicrobiota bacterium]